MNHCFEITAYRLFAYTTGKQFFVDEVDILLIIVDFASSVLGIEHFEVFVYDDKVRIFACRKASLIGQTEFHARIITSHA